MGILPIFHNLPPPKITGLKEGLQSPLAFVPLYGRPFALRIPITRPTWSVLPKIKYKHGYIEDSHVKDTTDILLLHITISSYIYVCVCTVHISCKTQKTNLPTNLPTTKTKLKKKVTICQKLHIVFFTSTSTPRKMCLKKGANLISPDHFTIVHPSWHISKVNPGTQR